MMRQFSRSSRFLDNSRRGFSLVEVIITMAIISILTALVMVRYGAFDSAVLLKNQAFEIALDVRDAQVQAISVRNQAEGSTEFREEYGVRFSTARNDEYIIWQDNNDNGTPADPNDPPRWHGSPTDETLLTIPLDERFEISEICFDGSCPTSATGVDISFRRPNFDAMIRRDSGSEHNQVDIVITSLRDPGNTRRVIITSTGQITVQ
jgi:prepilin-type N-terminal cleavage/methylation domain-containing protein